MGYCIFNGNEKLDQILNITGWQSLMGLAYVFGWEQKGTVLESWRDNKTGEMFPQVCFDGQKCKNGQWIQDDNWPGYYFFNDYQEITAEDGKSLAGALEGALEHMAEGSPSEEQAVGGSGEGDCDDGDSDVLDREHLISSWSGLDAQERIRGLQDRMKMWRCNVH